MTPRAMRGNLLLILTALIWGSAFVAQSLGLEHLGAFSFNGIRTLIGGVAVMPVALIVHRRQRGSQGRNLRQSLVGGAVCGCVLFVASNLQQWGLADTTVGKAGFITALYILFVPLIGLVLGKRVTRLFFAAVGVAVIGMFLLTMQGAAQISRGDMLVLLSAVSFAVHIIVIDHYSPGANGVMLAMMQFFVCGSLSLAAALCIGERIDAESLQGAMGAILYSGLLSCAVAYTLQIIAQRDVDPVVASLLMSLESVFAALCGWLVMGERLAPKEIAGCVLVFAAVIMAQWPQRQQNG